MGLEARFPSFGQDGRAGFAPKRAANANAARLPADALGEEDVCRAPGRKVGVGKGRERLGYALTSYEVFVDSKKLTS